MSLPLALALFAVVAVVVALLTWLVVRSSQLPPPRPEKLRPTRGADAPPDPDERRSAAPAPVTFTAGIPIPRSAPAEDGAVDLYAGYPDHHLLTAPPTIATSSGPVTLGDWLIHYNTKGDQVWPTVVATFYERAAAIPTVADYFTRADMARLQRHFVRALTIVVSRGLTVGMVRRIQKAHLSTRNSQGGGISSEIYETVMGILVGVLLEEGVPRSTIEQLAVVIAPLRDAIVRDPQSRGLEAGVR
jgi:truncated hemoglobin YjbI